MVDILVSVEHHYFCEPLEVWMTWDFPFLPRIGESVSPWLWIEQHVFEVDKVKKNLTEAGQKSLDNWSGDLTSWLYEMGISADVIYNLAYYRKRDDKTPYVHLFMREEENK